MKKKRLRKNRTRGQVKELNAINKLTGKMCEVPASKVEEIVREHFQGLRDWADLPLTHRSYKLPYFGTFEIKQPYLRNLIENAMEDE